MNPLPPVQDSVRPGATTNSKMAMPRVIRRAALALALAGAAAFGVIVYGAYRGDTSTTSDVPLITAESQPLRERPSDEGGMEIANRDSTIYDTLDGHANQGGLERLMPLPEQPLDGPAAPGNVPDPRRPDGTPALTAAEIRLLHQQQNNMVGDAAERAMSELTTAAGNLPQGAAQGRTSTMVLTDKTEKLEPPVAGTQTATAPSLEASPLEPQLEPVATPLAEAELAPVATPVAEAEATPAEVKAVAAIKPAAGPATRMVQLGAVRTQEAAKAEWVRLQKKFKTQLGTLDASIEQADLGARGIYWRIRGASVTAEQGKEICAQLVAAKQSCMVVGR
jgi:hypothetical protein